MSLVTSGDAAACPGSPTELRSIAATGYPSVPRRLYVDRIAGRDRDYSDIGRSAFAALSRGKEAARSAKCKSNTRQIGLGLLLYVSDFGSYPFYANPHETPSGDPSLAYWPERLHPYTLDHWTNTLYLCPGYKGPTPLRAFFRCVPSVES
jgi:hypothetical protein